MVGREGEGEIEGEGKEEKYIINYDSLLLTCQYFVLIVLVDVLSVNISIQYFIA